MNIVSSEQFLVDQFPRSLWPSIPTTLRLAYSAADALIEQEPILQVQSAKDNRGRIVSWAVDLAFQRLVASGQWLTATSRWRSFAKPTGRYLEIKLSHSVMTICQSDDPAKQPRNVVFRENARLNNQGLLALDDRLDEDVQGFPHFLLLHGYQALTFATIAVPHKEHERGHIYRTPNLLTLPHEMPTYVPAVENTDEEAILSLKKEIDEWRKAHDEQ